MRQNFRKMCDYRFGREGEKEAKNLVDIPGTGTAKSLGTP